MEFSYILLNPQDHWSPLIGSPRLLCLQKSKCAYSAYSSANRHLQPNLGLERFCYILAERLRGCFSLIGRILPRLVVSQWDVDVARTYFEDEIPALQPPSSGQQSEVQSAPARISPAPDTNTDTSTTVMGGETEPGAVYQFAKRPPELSFCQFLFNSQTGEILGRTPISWCKCPKR